DIFVFLCPAGNSKNDYPPNVKVVPIKNDKGLTAKWLFIHQAKLRLLVRKFKPDLFFSVAVPAIYLPVSQALILPEVNFVNYTNSSNKQLSRIYKKKLPRFLNKARYVLVQSDTSKSTLLKNFDICTDRVTVMSPGIDGFVAVIDAADKERIKKRYADSNEYFVFRGATGPSSQVLNLLKAFSAFKKRQKSKMQLIIMDKHANENTEFIKSLESFRFKKDVKILTLLSDKEKHLLFASAYAAVYLEDQVEVGSPELYSMASGIPVITYQTPLNSEIFGDAVLYAASKNVTELAERMTKIYHDETMRKVLIDHGQCLAKKFTWNNTLSPICRILDDVQDAAAKNR
ncbi:MAG: glycosyltransferase, partial [Ginsengibacter sp.]